MNKLALFGIGGLAALTMSLAGEQPRQPADLRAALQQRVTDGVASSPRQLSEQQRAELRRQLTEYARLAARRP